MQLPLHMKIVGNQAIIMRTGTCNTCISCEEIDFQRNWRLTKCEQSKKMATTNTVIESSDIFITYMN